jgi:hypothetical protein
MHEDNPLPEMQHPLGLLKQIPHIFYNPNSNVNDSQIVYRVHYSEKSLRELVHF